MYAVGVVSVTDVLNRAPSVCVVSVADVLKRASSVSVCNRCG